MSQLAVERFDQLFKFLSGFADDHKKVFFSSCAAIVGLAAFTPTLVQDYRLYMSYGANGSPQTIRGWLVSTVLLRSLSSWELVNTKMYESNDDRRTWLPDDWPRKRRESRPVMGTHPAPQRQLSQLPSEATKTELKRQFYALAKKNEKLIQLRPSAFEKHTQSMFVSDAIQVSQIAAETLREISHIHSTGDHSIHVTLAPQDCKKVLESGWGLRHPLDGAKSLKYLMGGTISYQYVLVYAPRNPEEIETAIEVVKASIGYMTGSRDVRS
ncbi:hypothetical protein MMC22_005277 [Lobaria immixta]|nr:hypothetical protein [Lobaria immixta]